jgi:hypothetical protein
VFRSSLGTLRELGKRELKTVVFIQSMPVIEAIVHAVIAIWKEVTLVISINDILRIAMTKICSVCITLVASAPLLSSHFTIIPLRCTLIPSYFSLTVDLVVLCCSKQGRSQGSASSGCRSGRAVN